MDAGEIFIWCLGIADCIFIFAVKYFVDKKIKKEK